MQAVAHFTTFNPALYPSFRPRSSSAASGAHFQTDIFERVADALRGGQPLGAAVSDLLPGLFALRLELAREIAQGGSPAQPNGSANILAMGWAKRWPMLAENLDFAWRVAQKVSRQLAPAINAAQLPGEFPDLGYFQFLQVLSWGVPAASMPAMTDIFDRSLQIEFGLVAAFLLDKEVVALAESRIDELARFVADAGQELGAAARELREGRAANLGHAAPLDALAIEAETELAETGLPEYLAQLPEYEY